MSRKERTRRTANHRLDQAAALAALPVPKQPIIKRPAMNALEGSRELGDSLYENRKPRTWRTLGDPTRKQKLEAALAAHDGPPRQTCGYGFSDSREDPPEIKVLRKEIDRLDRQERLEADILHYRQALNDPTTSLADQAYIRKFLPDLEKELTE